MPKGRRSESKLPSDDTGKDETASKDNDVVLFVSVLEECLCVRLLKKKDAIFTL